MLPGPVIMSTGASSAPSVSVPPYASSAMPCAPPTAHTSSTPSSRAAARIVGCGRPPNCACGGLAITSESDARGLGRHDVHHHAGRVDRVAARHVEPDPRDRHPAFGDRRAGAQRRRRVGAALVGVHRPGPVDRDLQRGPDIGRQRGECVVEPVRGHTHSPRPHTVERLAVLQRRLGPTLCDGLDDRANRGQHRLDVDAAARQRGTQLRRSSACGYAGRSGSSR